MWLSLIENPEVIQNVFFENPPNLQNVYWKDLQITNGQEIHCKLSFDIWEIPEKFPEKWVKKNVNTIQISMTLTETEILLLDLSNSFPNGILNIELTGQYKKVVFNSGGKDIFILKSKWVYVESVIGYMRE
ncbi:MAG: Imm50 family immunity protein [Chitinophagaceae bacterium]